jgi:hypothetical protein
MGLEQDDDIESSSLSGSKEKWGESPAEKARSKKAVQYLQRAQKDEKKAKTDNDDLFLILSRFLRNPLYDDIFAPIIHLLEISYPSRVILALIAFIYPEATLLVSEKLERPSMMQALKSLTRNDHYTPFDEKSLDPSIRKWMNIWITSWYEFILHGDGSLIMKQKLHTLLFSSSGRERILQAVIAVFIFFFQTRNINISESTARRYGDFIISELSKKVEEDMRQHQITDGDFLEGGENLDSLSLFGFGSSDQR